MTSVSQEDEFMEVTRKRKKRKATGSPTLPTLQKIGSSEPPPGTPTRPKPILDGVRAYPILDGGGGAKSSPG